MKINNFQGDLTDISATKEALVHNCMKVCLGTPDVRGLQVPFLQHDGIALTGSASF